MSRVSEASLQKVERDADEEDAPKTPMNVPA